MPTYEYRCADCGETFDIVQAFTDDVLTECPECGRLKKVFGSVGISFKGSGFYVNDSGSSKVSSHTSGSTSSDSSSNATANGTSSETKTAKSTKTTESAKPSESSPSKTSSSPSTD